MNSLIVLPGEAGSSPRPWGTQRYRGRHLRRRRIIPTPVGNAGARKRDRTPESDHPHARGERVLDRGDGGGTVGSSPRPWGTLLSRRREQPDLRIIPTPVGNARSTTRTPISPTDHPHARGERISREVRSGDDHGSSPRPWGTRAPGHGALRGARIIPTPVGNAIQSGHRGQGRTDHPHARGERDLDFPLGQTERGSSPRPWGTREVEDPRLKSPRIIPTPVGNAPWLRAIASSSPDHPHARGERAVAVRARDLPVGSSPRPWGTP